MPIFMIVWRILLISVNSFCLIVLCNRWHKYRAGWGPYTYDLWWSQILWSLFGVVLPIEAMLENRGFSTQTVFLTFISAATPYNLYRKDRERELYASTKDL